VSEAVEAALGGIFISYRRGDSEGQARALSIELANYVGEGSVFMDVDSIALGRDFRQSLHESLESCDAVLALIGPNWLDIRDPAGRRRLDDPDDFVRQEIAAALKRNIPVTPVLLQRASMPAQERLPDDLKDLVFRNGFELSHMRWHSDVREMAQRLGLGNIAVSPADAHSKSAAERISPKPSTAIASGAPDTAPQAPQTRRRALAAAAVVVATAGTAIAIPSVRRLMSKPPKPALRAIAFDFTSVDGKGVSLPTERASASMFTETLGSGGDLDMVAVPRGTFTMGSPIYEPERRRNEGPQHSVTLNPFFIGAGPITQAQWAAVATAHPAKLSHGFDPFPSFFKGDDLPVETISWNEADEFCRRLAEITGRDYRLPTDQSGNTPAARGRRVPSMSGQRSLRSWPITAARAAPYVATAAARPSPLTSMMA
jgi:hypothetical protein